jgi:hypothetical protein
MSRHPWRRAAANAACIAAMCVDASSTISNGTTGATRQGDQARKTPGHRHGTPAFRRNFQRLLNIDLGRRCSSVLSR